MKNEEKKAESKQDNSKQEESNSSEDKNKGSEEVKKIGFSNYIKNGEHVFYEIDISRGSGHLMAEDGSIKEGVSIDDDNDDETLDSDEFLENILATKDGKVRAFDIDLKKMIHIPLGIFQNIMAVN
ncbi:hypothetical protein RN70_12255 [Staphylococcus schleiferi]|uniref:hypothetical protein n=3 Tax=Staphylococcus coagulans TaxID=74706 RepID=UPI00067A430C|nr:hypothetical protein [Staphylococcus coagulans]AKS70196.1 hypothetical protein NP71_11965 [Staphylococcus schleiferi]AKS72315.1 hypothetical protein OA96_11240 [Staphylococcus schleiferi]AKS74603.1 hypothetical protein RN70_12255 [Staphylococcus schleiferi]MBT2832810.1 hypothetical protein [Staphylococcus coagulans]